MKVRWVYFFLVVYGVFGALGDAWAQGDVWVSGRVFDAEDGEPLIGATVVIPERGDGVVSGKDGTFRIKIPKENVRIEVKYLGYVALDTLFYVGGRQDFEMKLVEGGDFEVDFELWRDAIAYEEVVVVADDRSLVRSVQMGEVSLSRYEINHLPRLLGEADPIRFLQLTPGVQSSSEGGIGFYVRGGGVDQNLVLFDGATVYNPGHLLGFVSVFNPDIISEVSLMKSGIPARFGGRLSSVVRVRPERGESDSLRISGQIGLVASRLTMKRSFANGRGSFVFSGRRASIDLFVKPIVFSMLSEENLFLKESSYNFYDFSGGISYRFGEKDRVDFSAYYGNDDYGISRSSRIVETGMQWGNMVLSANWRHFFSDKFVMQTSFSKTDYHFDLSGSWSEYVFGLASSVDDHKGKVAFSYYGDKHKLKYGVEMIQHTFIPNEIDVDAGGLQMNFLSYKELYAYEGGLFIEDEFSMTDEIEVALGLRYSFYRQVGPYTEYLYDASGYLDDSIGYAAGEPLVFYHQPEPRVSVKYQLDEDASLKASYMHMAQYVHLGTSATVSLPTDIWLPSSKEILPEYGNQYSVGYFREMAEGQLEGSVELYYKNARNQLEFTRGVLTSSLTVSLDDNIVTGEGRSYGAEFFLRKKSGAFTGWGGYTISRVSRTFEMLNDGRVYPAKFDRRHDLSLAGIYDYNDRWNFSAVFVFVSGNAFTLPIGRYIIQGNLMNEYGALNNFRMPAYHRLDLSATRSFKCKGGRVSELDFSIYNAYNRANPFYIYFETTGDLESYRLEVKPVVVSLFPIVPTISWRFEF